MALESATPEDIRRHFGTGPLVFSRRKSTAPSPKQPAKTDGVPGPEAPSPEGNRSRNPKDKRDEGK